MGSKGRMPLTPPHMRHPVPSLHSEPLGCGMMHPLHGQYPPFDRLPPPEVMEHKLASQHEEMQRLDYENHRLAATHGTLRQELAVAQHELQVMHAQIGDAEAERGQQMHGMADNIARMEAELQGSEPLKLELQQAQGEAQKLVLSREDLVSKAQQLAQEHHRTLGDVQQIPALLSELEHLRQEYQHCRTTFGYEKKLYDNHLESLQEMAKNYDSMSREVEKLRAELTNTANADQHGPYGETSGTNDNEASGLHLGQNSYKDGYSIAQGLGPPFPTASLGGGNTTAGVQPGPASTSTGDNAPRWPHYDASADPSFDTQMSVNYNGQNYGAVTAVRGCHNDSQRGENLDPQRTGYDPQRGEIFYAWRTGYDTERGENFDAQRTGGYDPQRGANFDAQRTGYDPQRDQGYGMQRGLGYDAASRNSIYEAQPRGAAGSHGYAPAAENMPYSSMTPPARGGGGY